MKSISESKILKQVMIELSQFCTLFRNNTGKAWIGKDTYIKTKQNVTVNPGDVVIRKARRFHAGLVNGASDIIGWTKVEVTQEMVGTDVCLFSGIEIKSSSGRLTDDQEIFMNKIIESGGISFVARSADEAIILLSKRIEGLTNGRSDQNSGTRHDKTR